MWPTKKWNASNDLSFIEFSSLSDSPPGLFRDCQCHEAICSWGDRFWMLWVANFVVLLGHFLGEWTKTWAFRAFDPPNDDQQLQLSSWYEGQKWKKMLIDVHWNFGNQSIGLPIWAESNTIAIVFDQSVASLERHRCTRSSPLAELQDPSCCFLIPSKNL